MRNPGIWGLSSYCSISTELRRKGSLQERHSEGLGPRTGRGLEVGDVGNVGARY